MKANGKMKSEKSYRQEEEVPHKHPVAFSCSILDFS